MSLSIGAATDYLVTLAGQTAAGMLVNGKPMLVVDGWPEDLAFGMFVIGLTEPPPSPAGDTGSTHTWTALGAMRWEEDYTIPCYIDIRDGSTTQKAVRDLAISVFNGFWQLFRADLTLGGALHGGRYAEIDTVTFTPSNIGTAAEPGKRMLVQFGVHCRNLTT